MPDQFSPSGPCYTVQLRPGGERFESDTRRSVLQEAWQAGIELPGACRNGTCRACLCRLLSGQVSYLIAWPGLSAEEKHENWILPCVAAAQSPLIIEQTPVASDK
jgi:ferredoxin